MDGSLSGEDEERHAIAALMDPAALERRLGEARRRRESALAARATISNPAQEPEPAPSEPAPPAPEPARRRRRAVLPAIFIAGSLAGAVVAGFGPEALTRLMEPPRPPSGVAADIAAPSAANPAVGRPAVVTLAAAPSAFRAAVPDPLPDRPFSTSIDGVRIVLHAPAGADAAATAAAMKALDAARPGSLTRADARVTISASNVRYFHEADRPAAVEIAGRLSAALGSEPRIRDFTDFRPSPSEGSIEIWLAGEAPGTTARRTARPQAGPADIVLETVRRARDALDRTLDILPFITLR